MPISIEDCRDAAEVIIESAASSGCNFDIACHVIARLIQKSCDTLEEVVEIGKQENISHIKRLHTPMGNPSQLN